MATSRRQSRIKCEITTKRLKAEENTSALRKTRQRCFVVNKDCRLSFERVFDRKLEPTRFHGCGRGITSIVSPVAYYENIFSTLACHFLICSSL